MNKAVPPVIRSSLLAGMFTIACACNMHAASLTFSSSAPGGGDSPISNWTGASFDADNVGGTGVNSNGSPNNGNANDGTTYVSNNRPAQGQTFTTGPNAGGYTLNAITVRMAGYTNNTASGTNNTYWALTSTSSIFTVRVGQISGTTFIPMTVERATSGGSGTPGSGNSANGPGTYLTFTFSAPIVLKPNTTYAFDVATSSSGNYFEMLGIRDAASGGNPYAAGTAYTSGASGVANGTVTTQAGDRVFQVSLSAYTPAAPGAFVHPGLLNTAADLDQMRTNVALGIDPWKSGYNALAGSWMGQQNGGWPSHAQATITRSGSLNNTSLLYNDIAVCYGSALRWKITGDTAYANQAVALLNSWGYTLTSVAGDTNVLLTELYGYQFCCAAEIMRTYSGWAPADIAQFQTMIYNVFYPLADNFLSGHFGTGFSHYWANWDLAAMNTMYAIGVLNDNAALTTEATNYFYNGVGNGCIDRFVNYIHPGFLGQGQEIGRDQGHATLDVAEIATLCQMAWNQGVDLYGYENNRVLAVAEYTARYNLGNDVPFAPYANSDGWLMTGPSSQSRGANWRPGWATLYNHYVNIKGLAAPYTTTAYNNMGVNWYYNGDSPGWDYLTSAQPAIAAGAAPSGLTAIITAGQPALSWWGSAYATGYNVKRATTSGGPYTTIATGVTTNTYTDTSAVAGTTYYYVVSASTATRETANSNEAQAITSTPLVARLEFDDGSGTTAADSTGNGWTGTLVNSPTWATGKIGGDVSLASASSQYVTMPNGVVSSLSDFTISTWVYLNSNTAWSRVFDFGDGDGMYGGTDPWGHQLWFCERYMMLAVQSSTGRVHFGISNSCGYGEQSVEGAAALPTGQWAHVAVTMSGSTASIYVNGMLVGQNTGMYFSPFRIGSTTQDFLGKSQWRNDPYLNGNVDDFRIYRGALSAADIQTLANTGVAYLKFNESSGTSAADSTGDGWTGTLVNSPAWATGKLGNAVSLNGSSQYVTLPTGVVNGQATCTLTNWVYLNSVSNWARIFDFGSGTGTYMFLTPKNGANGKIRFAITTSSSSGEQKIDGTAALGTGGWHHVAVVLNGSTGTLYVDGAQVGQNISMTLTPSSLGATTQNYIGKSQWNDPYLNGIVDDFHIYSSALTAGQIASLYGGLAAPTVTVTAGDSQNTINWTAVPNATSYIVERSTTPGGPYTIVASGLSGTSYTDTGLTNGTTYYYQVVATNSVAQSSGSTEVNSTPVTPIPSGLSAGAWNGEADLKWSPVSGATYNVKRATTPGGPYSTIAGGVTSPTYIDTGLTNGTTYYYVVSAVKGAEGGNSAESSAAPHSDPIVNAWAHQDIGSVGLAGIATYSSGSYQVTGAGTDIFGTADACHYLYQSLTGDGTIFARVTGVDSTDPWAKAGVMMRNTLDANSANVVAVVTPSNGASFQYRSTTGGSSSYVNVAGITAPYWVMISRVGSTFTSYISPDGMTWTTVGSQTITMNSTIYVGMVVTSHNTSLLCTGSFSNLAIVPTVDWDTTDIGSVPFAGGSFYSNAVATVAGSGADIWGSSDAFRYTYLSASGDCDITARVASVDNTNPSAKAGVMIRETLNANSTHAMAIVTPGAGVGFQWRSSTGGSSSSTTMQSGLTAPYWVRVTRVGNVFTAYYSADGATWTSIGSQTISMATNVYIGLPVTSHTTSAICGATIDNVTVDQ